MLQTINLSIVTVCYNSEKYIEDLQKIICKLKESYLFEYIIIDGNSTDNTLNILNKYNRSIDILLSENDSGIYNAMNKGIKIAKNNYIWIVNSDDLPILNNFKYVVDLLSSYQFDLYAFSINRVKNGTSVLITPRKSINSFVASITTPYKHPGLIVSRNSYSKVGYYDEVYKTAGDYDWMLRSLSHNLKIYSSTVPISLVRDVGITSGSKGLTNPHEVEKAIFNFHKNKLYTKFFMFIRIFIKYVF